jgi:tetratricopeptide (TPR) repeat protein
MLNSSTAAPVRKYLAIVLVATLLLAIVLLGRGRARSSRAINHFMDGQEALNSRDYERAIDCFTAAIKLEPSQARFYVERALAYHLKGDEDKAVADYSEAIRLDPQTAGAGAYAFRGEAHLNKKDYDRALADLDEALRLGIESPFTRAFTLVNRGIAHDEKGDHDKAIADFNEAIRLEPKLPKAYHDRGVAYLQKGDSAKAVADFTEFLKFQPESGIGYANRARAYRAAGDDARAASDERKAKELGE